MNIRQAKFSHEFHNFHLNWANKLCDGVHMKFGWIKPLSKIPMKCSNEVCIKWISLENHIHEKFMWISCEGRFTWISREKYLPVFKLMNNEHLLAVFVMSLPGLLIFLLLLISLYSNSALPSPSSLNIRLLGLK